MTYVVLCKLLVHIALLALIQAAIRYGADEQCIRYLFIYFYRCKDLNFLIAGPRQAYSKLIPKFTKLALEGKPYPLMGDGMHSR